MGIKDRPYVGNWQMNRTLVRHTPDAIVYINGHSEFSVCASCNKKMDLNKYITTVSCDAGVEPNASASISLSVPKMSSDVFSHDGNYVLRPGLEVVIYMRGYFPMEGYALLGQDSEEGDNTPVYPYYQTFRGVVTSVSHDFSGGFYSATMSCANLLHFWSNQYLSTNGAVFGPRPDGSGVTPNLTGHSFTNATPYNIIYTLMRTGFGAAYSVGWSVNQRTNVDAESDSSDKSLYSHAAEWWEKRWQSSSMKLRMYGFDGSLFNFLEQSFLGMFGSKSADRKFILSYNTLPDGTSKNFNMEEGRQATARAIGYAASETTAAFMDAKGYKLDILKMQAFTFDMGNIANVNFFESEYMSKMEIAEAVTGLTGFEFYQDVDGDMVFKPPFYNMDTREDPVYVIEDRDLITISETETEPEATYVKGTGGLFGNTTGVLSGEFGTKQAMYIDWRLVAKFGWKETSFESHYLNNASQLYVSAISRLDIANASTKSADITIPIRSELRPGYPVYVRSLDCFFYVRNISHNFSPGGECTTTLTCIAKRSKFLPPGLPDRSEGQGSNPIPTLRDVKLGEAGSYPPMPLYVYPEDVENNEEESSGPPRIMGFPNCVMALDPNKINTSFIGDGSLVFSQPDNAFDFALSQGVLHRDPENQDSYRLENGDGTYEAITKNRFLSTWENSYTYLQAYNENPSQENYDKILGSIGGSDTLASTLLAITTQFYGSVEDPTGLKNWVFIQKSLKTMYGYPAVTGTYRYFSSSAEEKSDQSPSQVIFKDSSAELGFQTVGSPPADSSLTVLRQEGDRIKIKSGKPDLAFRVYGFTGQDQSDYKDTTTDQIRFVTFQKVTYVKTVDLVVLGNNFLSALMVEKNAFLEAVSRVLKSFSSSVSPDEFASVRLGTEGLGYDSLFTAIKEYEETLAVSSKVPEERERASSLKNALSSIFTKPYFKGVSKTEISPDGTESLVVTQERVPGYRKYGNRDPDTNTVLQTRYSNTRNKSDSRALDTIVGDAARALTNYMVATQEAFKKEVESGSVELDEFTEGELITSRNEVLALLEGYEGSQPDQPTAHSTVEKEEGVPTAVIPVSDNSGYEVYGGLAYGRGITIDTQYQLLSTQGTSIDAQSAESIEAFISGLIGSGADIPGSLGSLTVERKSVLAANLGLPQGSSDEQIVEAIEKLAQNSKSGSAFIRNNPITSNSRGMSYTQSLGIEELANLTVGDAGEICVCKGVEASHFLQAFTGDYIRVDSDSVGEFLRTEATVSGESWKVTRDAVSGKSVSTNSAIKSGLVAYDKIAENFNTAVESLENLPELPELDEEG